MFKKIFNFLAEVGHIIKENHTALSEHDIYTEMIEELYKKENLN